jgi:FkbM family methyltransferase
MQIKGMEPHSAGIIGDFGKRISPLLARAINTKRLRNPARLTGIYLDIIQGKGSGTGWDMAGEISAAAAFLKNASDPVIFDIGANHGEWTSGIWRTLGRGRYFAFEPQDECQASLTNTAVPTLKVIQSAVSDQAGDMDLHSDFDGSGLASFYERAETYLKRPTRVQRVPVTTVDLAIDSYGLQRIDFMKIDVEGAELQVLLGAKHALKAQTIRAFAFEFGSANIYSRVFFRDFWELITSNGYALWRIVPGGSLRPITTYREDLEHFRGVSNYIASISAA